MDLKNFLILLVTGINLLLGLFIYLNKRDKATNKIYGIVASTVAYWGVGMVLYRTSTTVADTIFWCKILYTAPVFIVISFLIFTYIFPDEQKTPHKLLAALSSVGFLLLLLTLFTNSIIKDALINPGQEKIILWGNLYFVYVIFISGSFLWSYINLIKKIRASSGSIQTQIKYVFWGTFLASTIGMFTNLLLPSFGIFYLNWAGQIASLIMVIFIAWSIIKHQTMDVRLTATEVFTAMILILLGIQVFQSQNSRDFFINAVIFLMSFLFGVLLIQGIINENRAKDRIVSLALRLRQANIELKKIDEAKSEFISIASHQLRTPLTAIGGYASLMLEGAYGKIGGKIKEALKKIIDVNRGLVTLVNDLLNLSRIERGKIIYDFKPESLVNLVEKTISEISNLANAKNLKIFWQKPDIAPLLMLDKDKMQNVILNLIDNAIKYTPEGEIEIKIYQENNDLLLRVKDSGIGMNEETQKHIFNKFVRSDEGRHVNATGTGLGLYIAKIIVEAHRGRIWAESEGLNKGSCFFISLPIQS